MPSPRASGQLAPSDGTSTGDVSVIVAVVVTVLAWASAFVVIRGVVGDYGAGPLTLGRLLIGAVTLSLLSIGRRFVRPTPREWGLLVLIGLAWFGGYNLALNAGERQVDAGTAAMLIQVGPILIGVLAGLVLHEGLPRPLVIGGLVAFAGTLVIGVATSTGGSHASGVLLVLLAAVLYAVAMVAQKVVLRRLPGLQVTWLACSIGTVGCLPLAGQLVSAVGAAPLRSSLGVVYLGVVPTAIAFSTWAYALSRTDAGRLGVTTFAVPPVAIALGWVLLGEVPVVLAVVGGAVSLIGVGISRRRARRPRVPPPG